MRTLKTLLTAATLTAVIIAAAVGIIEASERRVAYLETESAYFECIQSGLSQSECAVGVGLSH